ncbi:ABC1 kinase family protein [Desulfotalea psychrophila]|uniref:Hypothetical membrane protein n=1 Tax=Desulfotalea psychrophila (strain LSv54 / DSM 12343) TaxID=177439 RepID=Q6AQ53_DESPS|nr:AarF/UbiB family protein [Desulfotalea psychrophila]CAG35520.1 hypothetical membrane protein [Desulfotalea psychrophila LSv54]
MLEKEFLGKKRELFQSIEETPLATASIAQVHRARLYDGSKIVLKIIRPGNKKLIEEDMALFETLAQIVDQYFSNLGYSARAVAKEFSRQLSQETNFINEGQSTERLGKYFTDDPQIHFPKVYWEATTRNVLALEEIQGEMLASLNPEELTKAQRRSIVANGTNAVFKQCLEFGLFHADPHPGNIILRKDGSLCFIDCGMVGRLDKRTTDQLINLVTGIIDGDSEKLRRVVIELTDVDPALTTTRDFYIELQHLTSQLQSDNLDNFNISEMLSDFFTMLQRFKIRCPSDLLLLTKALTTIEGVAEQFDPSFDVINHVRPMIEKVIVTRYSMKAIHKRFGRSIVQYLELLEEIPGGLHDILERFRRDRFTFNLELKRIEHLASHIDTSSRIMGMSMIIAALIVGSSILILADRISQQPGFIGTLGLLGLAFAGVSTAGFIVSFLLPKAKVDD